MLEIRHFQKIYILSLTEHSDEHMKHSVKHLHLHWGFHSHSFFSSVMIVAREHNPFLVACVWRETKARNPSLLAPQAFSHEILARYLHFAIMWLVCYTGCKQTTNTKWKECGSFVSSHFFGGALPDIPKNPLQRTHGLTIYRIFFTYDQV